MALRFSKLICIDWIYRNLAIILAQLKLTVPMC